MTEVGMANDVLTKDAWDKMKNLAASPGTTYCEIKVNPYDSEAYKNLLKKPGLTVFRETYLEKDCSDACTLYLLSHSSSVFLMGRMFLIDPEASCFTTTEDITASKRYCSLAHENLSHGLKLYEDSMDNRFFSVRNTSYGDQEIFIHSKTKGDQYLDYTGDFKSSLCYDLELIENK